MIRNNGFHNRHSPFNRAFNPASLFTNGEQGWVYDPSNFATLFQDSIGTTPVTAVEQPVGLQLDLSQNLTIGPELVINGDFSSATGWTLVGAGVSITGGKLVFNSAGATQYATQNILTLGKTYLVTFTISDYSAGSVRIAAGGTNGVLRSANGTYTQYVQCTSDTNFYIITVPASNTLNVDNVTVKEVLGNHRFQATSANRPVVSARVNLLTKTEEFDDAGWVKVALGVSVSPNVAIAPNGTLTADKLIGMAPATKEMYSPVATIPANVSFTASVAAKVAEYSWIYIVCNVNASLSGTFFNLATGEIGNTVGTGSTPAISPLGDGWYRVSSTRTSTVTSGFVEIFPATGNGIVAPTFVGDGTSGIFIWGADLRSSTQGVGLPDYQRVNTSTDYTSTGFPIYLKANGSNQTMATNSINFTATDSMTLWVGARLLSNPTAGLLTELSVNSDSNNGTFSIFRPAGGGGTQWYVQSRGNAITAASATGYGVNTTQVFNATSDISGDVLIARVNGAQVATSTGDQGTGNYGNYPAYFYARAGAGSFFNGNDYASITRGATSTATQITDGETWINSKTKAY